MGLKIKSIKNHYIICGYGRIGKIVSQELKLMQIPFRVIEKNPVIKEELEANGISYIIDDATDEEILIEAGIERAKVLISLSTSDADNLFITMIARGLNPDLFILVRADQELSQKKFLRAGANGVFLPYLFGGHKIAQTITKPAMTDFLELTTNNKDMDLKMEELFVEERSSLNGLTLKIPKSGRR